MKVTCELAPPGTDGFTVYAEVGTRKLNVSKVMLTGESRASYELLPGPDAAEYLSLQNLIRVRLAKAVDDVIARRDGLVIDKTGRFAPSQPPGATS